MKKPCLDCNIAFQGKDSRCDACRKARLATRDRASAKTRGYDKTYWRNRAIILASQKWCVYCGHVPAEGDKPLTADHKVPLSRGGTNDLDNLAACCKACNDSKQDKTAQEFISWRHAQGE